MEDKVEESLFKVEEPDEDGCVRIRSSEAASSSARTSVRKHSRGSTFSVSRVDCSG